MNPKSLLVLVAHPDDAEFYAGGTIAKFIRDGFKAVIIIASDGSKGSFTHKPSQLVNLRTLEAARGAAVLGAEPPIHLNHPDMELDGLPPGYLRRQFIKLIREYKPDIIISEDPFPPYEVHPDHRVVAWAASDAIAFSPLPLVHPEQLKGGLKPHFIPEKYFFSDSSDLSNKIVDITKTIEVKLYALAEHKTQMKFLVEDVRMQAHLAGVELDELLGPALSDPLLAVSWAIKEQARRVGEPAGLDYAEAFRYVRFHPFIESLLEHSKQEI